MSQPLVVSIPHHLGRAEAVRRLKSGLGSVRTSFGNVLTVQEETWTDDHLQFCVSALGQSANGTIDVADARPAGSDVAVAAGEACPAHPARD